MVDCAIILAAGENRRMGSQVDVKASLQIGTESFLSRHIRLLKGHGVTRIYVVASMRSAPVLIPHEGDAVSVVISPYSSRHVGSSLSVLCGLDAVIRHNAQADVVVMDADILYEDALLELVLRQSEHRSRLFAIGRVHGDLEEVLVYGCDPDTPVLLGKGLPTAVTDSLTLLGESLGIIYLSPSEVRYCRELIRWIAGTPPSGIGFGYSGALSEHEEVWQYLFSLRRLGVAQLPGHLLFAECDTPEDYAYVCRTLVPAIEQRQSARAYAPVHVAEST